MNTTQQKQKLVVVLCDNHSHGQLEKILKDTWEGRNVPVLTNWEALAPCTHCLVVAVMSAMEEATLQSISHNIPMLLPKGCKVGMVLVEPFAFEEAGAKMQVRLLESLGGCKMDFVETRSMDDYAKAGGQLKGLREFFAAVYADILGATEKAVAENWGEVFM